MDLSEKTVNQEYIYKGRIINLRVDDALLPNGKPALREVVEHPGGVCVAALTKDNELLMVNQFRYPYMEEVLELPAGKLNPGEDPLECGRRELEEETGAVADEYVSLGQLYPSPGYCDEIIYMYAAKGLQLGDSRPDEDEFLNLKKVPLKTAVDMIMKGEIKDAKTQAAVLKLYLLVKRGIFCGE
ncbi:MAG TPA: NUDIX hydrolase [Clostridiales bacterium]|nr:NUDIX hydrolase [Clostridiales bacterium]